MLSPLSLSGVFPGGSVVKILPANAGSAGFILGYGSSLEKEMATQYLVQYPCLVNLMDRGAWGAPVHGVAKSQTRLSTAAVIGQADRCQCSPQTGMDALYISGCEHRAGGGGGGGV